jgi:hypothetical protein
MLFRERDEKHRSESVILANDDGNGVTMSVRKNGKMFGIQFVTSGAGPKSSRSLQPLAAEAVGLRVGDVQGVVQEWAETSA